MPRVTLRFYSDSKAIYVDTFSFSTDELDLPSVIDFRKDTIVKRDVSLPEGREFKVVLDQEILKNNALRLGSQLHKGFVVKGTKGVHITAIEEEGSRVLATLVVEAGCTRTVAPSSQQRLPAGSLPAKRPRDADDGYRDRPRPPPPPPRNSSAAPAGGGEAQSSGRRGRQLDNIVTNFITIQPNGKVSAPQSVSLLQRYRPSVRMLFIKDATLAPHPRVAPLLSQSMVRIYGVHFGEYDDKIVQKEKEGKRALLVSLHTSAWRGASQFPSCLRRPPRLARTALVAR